MEQLASSLLTIGEFARLGGVSIKALRLYARLGLLTPASVRSQSRYRLYATSQIPTLHRILMLKNAGVPLAQIGDQLTRRDEAGLSRIRASLRSRAAEIQQQLAWVEAELHAARHEASAALQVVVKRSPEMRVLSRRSRIESYDEADGMLQDLERTAPVRARVVAGAIWHDCGDTKRGIDCEAFWILNRECRAGATKTLAASTIAAVLHEGDESTIGDSYQAAKRWIADNHYRIVGPNREIYLRPSSRESSMPLIEIQFPVSRRAQSGRRQSC